MYSLSNEGLSGMRRLRFGSMGELPLKVRSRFSDGEDTHPMDVSLIDTVKSVKNQIDVVNAQLNSAADPQLIEGLVYELKSLHVKFDYLIAQCKERGVTADFY